MPPTSSRYAGGGGVPRSRSLCVRRSHFCVVISVSGAHGTSPPRHTTPRHPTPRHPTPQEVLTVRVRALRIDEVDGFETMVLSLSHRRLCFFCRILSLIVFAPEERMLNDRAPDHVIKSLELLQLRRDRLVTTDTAVDSNMLRLLNIPGLLERLVNILRVMGYSPALQHISASSLGENLSAAAAASGCVGGGGISAGGWGLSGA